MAKTVISPCSKPQELFLTLRDGTGKRSKYATEDGEEVDIIFYGGQAGGGRFAPFTGNGEVKNLLKCWKPLKSIYHCEAKAKATV